jgi:hypothetical protein
MYPFQSIFFEWIGIELSLILFQSTSIHIDWDEYMHIKLSHTRVQSVEVLPFRLLHPVRHDVYGHSPHSTGHSWTRNGNGRCWRRRLKTWPEKHGVVLLTERQFASSVSSAGRPASMPSVPLLSDQNSPFPCQISTWIQPPKHCCCCLLSVCKSKTEILYRFWGPLLNWSWDNQINHGQSNLWPNFN